MIVVWREWFPPAVVKQLKKLGKLPRNQSDFENYRSDTGAHVAARIAEYAHAFDSEAFAQGGKIVIMEPKEFAGTYTIEVDWSPTFTARNEPEE